MTKISYLWFLQDRRQLHQCEKGKDPSQYGRTQLLHWRMRYSKSHASEQKIPQFWAEEQKAKPYATSKQVVGRAQLEGPCVKHHHMSTAQFKKRTTHLDIPGNYDDPFQHVVKTCPFCNSAKPRPERSRVSGRRAEKFGDLIFLDHGSAKIGDKTFRFMIILDGATSHLTAYPCKSTSTSEVIAQIHEWMDTFQMNPQAICAEMSFHHPHDLQAFYRMHNVKRVPTGPHAPWPNRAEMGVRLFKKIRSALVDTASQNQEPDHSDTNHSCSVDAQGSNGEKYTGDLLWQKNHGTGHGTNTKRSPGPSFHESRTAYIYANQAGSPQ